MSPVCCVDSPGAGKSPFLLVRCCHLISAALAGKHSVAISGSADAARRIDPRLEKCGWPGEKSRAVFIKGAAQFEPCADAIGSGPKFRPVRRHWSTLN